MMMIFIIIIMIIILILILTRYLLDVHSTFWITKLCKKECFFITKQCVSE